MNILKYTLNIFQIDDKLLPTHDQHFSEYMVNNFQHTMNIFKYTVNKFPNTGRTFFNIRWTFFTNTQ